MIYKEKHPQQILIVSQNQWHLWMTGSVAVECKVEIQDRLKKVNEPMISTTLFLRLLQLRPKSSSH